MFVFAFERVARKSKRHELITRNLPQSALFHLGDELSGSIEINGINAKQLGLGQMRRTLSLIPQGDFSLKILVCLRIEQHSSNRFIPTFRKRP